jgi:hypothetical protein
MEKTVFNLSKLNKDKIKYKKMSKYIRIRYDSSKLMLSTPLLKISSLERNEKLNIIKLKINNDNIKEYNFGKNLINLDKFILDSAKENRSWFKEDNYEYKGLVENNEITFKFKESDNVKIKCNGESIDIKELKENYLVKVIFDVSGIWINKNKFGIYLKPYLFDIDVDYIFDDSDEEIEENLLENKFEFSSSDSEEKKNEENHIEMNI